MKTNSVQNLSFLIFLFGVCFFCFNQPVFANDFSSSNFVVKDPVFSEGAEYATSSNFSLWSSISQNAIGISNSASKQIKSGFLYFFTSTSSSSGGGGGSGGGGSGGSIFFGGGGGGVPEFTYPVDGGATSTESFICSKVIDLNCDGRVNLKDLSILFSEPRALNVKVMSLIFSSWTEKISKPSFVLESNSVNADLKLKNSETGLAQFESVLSSTTKKIDKIRISIGQAILKFIRTLGSFAIRLFRF